MTHKVHVKFHSEALLEELEARQLFSGGIEGILADNNEPETAVHREVHSDPEIIESPESIAESTENLIRQELVFIDTDVENYQQLLNDIISQGDEERNIEVVLLDNQRDGIEQITETLADFQNLDAVHLISHGSEGCVDIGNTTLDAETLNENLLDISAWSDAFTEDGDFLIYGCNLAATEEGQSLVQSLSSLTHTDVAASDDLTGQAELGGDWDLEFNAGIIESTIAISAEAQQSWDSVLAETVYVSHTTDTNDFEIKNTDSAGQTFTYDSGNGTYDVNRISIQLYEDNAPNQTVTVSLQDSWNGNVLGSATISSASLTANFFWYDFDFSDVTLDDGTSYVIKLTTDGSGGVFFAPDDDAGYAGGDLLDKSGNVDSGKDMTFKVSQFTAEANQFVVTTTADSGAGSLRQAIIDANATANSVAGADVITFDINADGTQQTITLSSALPTINEAVTIDGYSQYGALNPVTPTPIIIIDGNGGSYDGFEITSSDSTILGLVINNFDGSGIYLNGAGATSNTIQGNYIGLSADGTAEVTNTGSGIAIVSGASSNVIGGSGAGEGNVISGNGDSGIGIWDAGSDNNIIQGNYIGTNAAGTGAIGNNGTDGINIWAAAGTVIGGSNVGEGNVISANADGILLNNANNSTISGNIIGTNASGTADMGNTKWGIEVYRSSNTTIGGTADQERNVISGNDDSGIILYGAETTGTVIQGNYIGTNATGTAAIANTNDGIIIDGSVGDSPSANIIGGTTATERNIISGNGEDGVIMIGGAFNNTILGNYIGTDATGMIALGNVRHGVTLYDGVTGNTIGGSVAGAGNVISASGSNGIVIDGAGGSTTDNNAIQGNYIGTDATGLIALGNAGRGIQIFNGADTNTVGGIVLGARNVISGNGTDGVRISGSNTINNSVQGNYIGTDKNGVSDLGNNTGILIDVNASNNQIGGNTAEARNIISGNNYAGIRIGAADNNTIQGNYIGTDISGTLSVSTSSFGIVLDNGSSSNMIGGSGADEGNLIAFVDWGINIVNDLSDNNAILRNSIHSNGNMGINLTVDNVATSNDSNDSDTVANEGQNFPVLNTASTTGTEITITGTLNSTASSYFRIEFFANSSGDVTGHGEGEIYLGYANVATDSSGNVNINAVLSVSVADDAVISATATKSDVNYTAFTDTSEFALNIQATAPNIPPVNSVPADQSTDEDATLVFNAVNGNLISIGDADAGGSVLETTLSVSNGILRLSDIGGLTFVAGSDSSSTMTIQGTLTDINAALDGLSYTPTTDYSGSDTLTLSTLDSELVSLNIDANLLGYYSFDDTADLGNDSSSAGTNGGTIAGATATVDATHGEVLDFDGNDYVQIGGLYGEPADVTLSAWVNLTTAAPKASQVISLGDSMILQVDNAENGTFGVSGAYYNGSDWLNLSTGIFIEGTGWHHIAYAFDDTNNTQTIYIDGVAINTEVVTASISYTLGTDTFIGTHATSEVDYDFTGRIDDARIYGRALSTDEIANLANDINLQDSDTIAITVAAVNDAPVIYDASNVLMNENVFINEIHYDNTGTDSGERIELAGVAGQDLTGWKLALYNGNDGKMGTETALSGVFTDQHFGYGFITIDYAVNGMQNDMEAIALVDAVGNVVQFISYEGSFTAVDGLAIGLTSTNIDPDIDDAININETAGTPVGFSLQLNGTGANQTWSVEAANTFGSINTAQDFSGGLGTLKPESVLEDTELTFNVANGNAIMISDADADSGATDPMLVTLSVNQGTLTLGSTAGLSSLNGNGTDSVSFSGSITEVNAALEGLVYQGILNYSGSDTLTVFVDDQGNTGGSSLTFTATKDITVTAVNDAPEITIGSVTAFTEDNGNAVGSAVATFSTSDAESDTVTVTLSDTVNYALSGNTVVLTQAGLDLVNAGTDLPAFTLTPSDGTDSGTAGNVDPTVTAVNDAPEITIGSVTAFTEDNGNAVGDAVATFSTSDAESDTVTVTLSDTVNYALSGNTVVLTQAGLDLVNAGTDLPAFTLIPNDGTIDGTAGNVDPTVTAVNDAPEITIDSAVNFTEDAVTNAVGSAVATFSTSDAEGDAVTVTLSDTINYALSGNTVVLTQAGLDLINAGTDLPAFTLIPNDGTIDGTAGNVDPTVTAVNDAPTVANIIPDQTATEDVAFNFTFNTNTFIDLDSDTLTYTSDASGWLSFDSQTRTLSGTPLNADVGTITVTVTARDGHGGSVSDSFDIITSNTNDVAVIAGVDTGTVQEDVSVLNNNISTSGLLNISDEDNAEAVFIAETITGSYGELALQEDGNWTYTANNTQASIQQLGLGESITDSITVSSVDNTHHNVVITINGTDDISVIAGTLIDSVSEDGVLTSSGALTVTDIDSSDSSHFEDVIAQAGDNGYGTFSIIANVWSFTLDNNHTEVQALDSGETLTDSYTFITSDGVAQQVVVTINGTEDIPVLDLTAGTVVAKEGDTFRQIITASDVDLEIVSITASSLPAWLSLIDNGDGTAILTGTPGNAEVGDHSVVLVVSDGEVSSSQRFTVTVASSRDDALLFSHFLEEPGFSSTAAINEIREGTEAISTVLSLSAVEGEQEGEATLRQQKKIESVFQLFEESIGVKNNDEEQEVLEDTRKPLDSSSHFKLEKGIEKWHKSQLLILDKIDLRLEGDKDVFELTEIKANEDLWNNIDLMREQMNADTETLKKQDFEIEFVAAASIGITAGFVNWVLRGGALLSSLLSSASLFKQFDPLAVVFSQNKTFEKMPKTDSADEQDDIEKLFDKKNAK